MKRNIFLYLFLFVSLWVIFQYVNNSKVWESQENKIANLQTKLTDLEVQLATKDTLSMKMEERLSNIEYFTLLGNENTKEYFDNDELNVKDIQPDVIDGLYAKNTVKGNDLIPFEGDGRAFQINRVQVLNHRWIIADFSDGKRWGEILIEYFINENGTVDYNGVESLVYP